MTVSHLMIISLIWYCSCIELCAGFYSEIEGMRGPIAGTPDVHVQDLGKIANMFGGCQLQILVLFPFGLDNIGDVSVPHTFYRNNQYYVKDYFEVPGSGRPLTNGQVDSNHWKLTSRSFCKAEITVNPRRGAYDPEKIKQISPSDRIREWFMLEPQFDSSYIYQVLVITDIPVLPPTAFHWDNPFSTEYLGPLYYRGRRRIIEKTYNYINAPNHNTQSQYYYSTVPKMYYILCKEVIRGDRGIGMTLGENELIKLRTERLDIMCLSCRPNSVVQSSWFDRDAVNRIMETGHEVVKHGPILAHSMAFSLLTSNGLIRLRGLAPEGGDVSPPFSTSRTSSLEDLHFVKLNRIKDPKEMSALTRQVISGTLKPVLPETLLIHTLLNKHSNMSLSKQLVIHGPDKKSTFYSHYEPFAQESILGPGVDASFSIHRGSLVPTAESSFAFITCSNTSQEPQGGLLSKPYERNTWVVFWITMAAVCFFLLLIMSEGQSTFGAVFGLSVMISRILLENYQDMSHRLKKWPTAFAIVTVSVALSAITITNSYRGVLTSDLVMAPHITGPETFQQILRNGSWKFVPFYNSRLNDLVAPSARIEHNFAYIYGKLEAEYYYSLRDTDRTNLSKDLRYMYVSSLDSYHDSIEKLNSTVNCSCENTAFVVVKASAMSAVDVPSTCRQKLRYEKFVMSKDTFLPSYFSWASKWSRPGRFFRSLQRLCETGVYNWFNRILRQGNTGLTVNNNVVESADEKQVVAALAMHSLIVNSAFELWEGAILVSVGVFIVEVLVHFVGKSFWCGFPYLP